MSEGLRTVNLTQGGSPLRTAYLPAYQVKLLLRGGV